MTYPTATRERSRRGTRRCQVTAGRWWLFGFPIGRDELHPRRVMLVWDAVSGLSGDPELVADILERAHTLGRDLTDSASIFSLALQLTMVGAEVGGDIPLATNSIRD